MSGFLLGGGSRTLFKLRGILIVAVLLVPIVSLSNPPDIEKRLSPVLGGTSVEWPWLVALLLVPGDPDPYYSQFCAGSLIAPQWILTAAHCFYGYEDDEYEVLVGTTVLRPGYGTRYHVSEVIVHENFVPPIASEGIAFNNDIALLKLSRPVTDITPVDLPPPNFNTDDVPPGTFATLRGWGATLYNEKFDFGHSFPETLMTIDLPMRGFAECSAAMGETWFSKNMLCAGEPEGGRDTCSGDSGGPLAIASDNTNGVLQLGVVSWGIGCGLSGYYGVYTRLSQYSLWISRHICAENEIPPAPAVDIDVSETAVKIHWQSNLPDSSYRIYFTGADNAGPVRMIDMGRENSYNRYSPFSSLDFNIRFAVQSYRGMCNGGFSEIYTLKH